jgi:hypothetical protein
LTVGVLDTTKPTTIKGFWGLTIDCDIWFGENKHEYIKTMLS